MGLLGCCDPTGEPTSSTQKSELEEDIALVKNDIVKEFLLRHNCGIQFVFSPPNASHFGGVFERMIRSTRNILDVLLEQHGSQLNDE